MITFNTKLLGDTTELKKLLEYQQFVFNFASKEQFTEKKNSLVVLHSKVYTAVRKLNPEIPSQVIIRGEHDCLASYRSIKSNKHKIKKPIEKKNLSMRLDKRLYSKDKTDKYAIRLTTTGKRQSFKFVVYPKLKELLDKYQYCDPTIYSFRCFLCI